MESLLNFSPEVVVALNRGAGSLAFLLPAGAVKVRQVSISPQPMAFIKVLPCIFMRRNVSRIEVDVDQFNWKRNLGPRRSRDGEEPVKRGGRHSRAFNVFLRHRPAAMESHVDIQHEVI